MGNPHRWGKSHLQCRPSAEETKGVVGTLVNVQHLPHLKGELNYSEGKRAEY